VGAIPGADLWARWVVGYADLLRRNGRPMSDEDRISHARRILVSAPRLQVMIDDLLKLPGRKHHG
jgi:hypothetical protein